MTDTKNSERILSKYKILLEDICNTRVYQYLKEKYNSNRFEPRVTMDKVHLEILGFSKKEINDWLPQIYDALTEELKITKKVK